MSSKAITWAFGLKGLSSSVKFVLVALADNADAADRAWPSVKTIVEKTNLNEKTVWKALDTLEEQGFIKDSGLRKGKTNQVKIYQLYTEKTEADIQSEHHQKRNTLESKTPPKTEVLNTSKNGAIKDHQKRNTSKNGTLPNFPSKTSNFSVKDLQFFQETPPNLEDGTYIEPYIEPLVEPSDIRQVSENLPVAISPPVEKRKNEVDVVFNHWKEVMHSPRSVLDNNRKKKIQAALKHYSVADLLKAIDGCSRSAFHMGINEKGTKFNSIDLIFRNSEKIEQFMGFVDKPPTPQHSRTCSIEEQNARNKESIFGPIDEPYTIIQ